MLLWPAFSSVGVGIAGSVRFRGVLRSYDFSSSVLLPRGRWGVVPEAPAQGRLDSAVAAQHHGGGRRRAFGDRQPW